MKESVFERELREYLFLSVLINARLHVRDLEVERKFESMVADQSAERIECLWQLLDGWIHG